MLIIDGHNLIGRAPGLSLGREEEAREAVLRRVAAMQGHRREPALVVFDGNRPGAAKEERFGGVRVVFAPAGRTADEEILRRLRRGNPRGSAVVTSDRDLALQARDLGARVESSESFWRRLARPPQEPPPEKPEASAGEVEEWLAAFQKRRTKTHKM